jgi:hypothetical protein
MILINEKFLKNLKLIILLLFIIKLQVLIMVQLEKNLINGVIMEYLSLHLINVLI